MEIKVRVEQPKVISLKIKEVVAGGVSTKDATATSNDLLVGKTAYSYDGKIEGNIETYVGDIYGETQILDTLLVDKNGIYDVMQYGIVNVNVPTQKYYNDGYNQGYNDGKLEGKVKISTLSNFDGKPTGNENEYYYNIVSNNGIWTAANLIPFGGEENATYLMIAKIKCETANVIGVGFIYEDGSSSFGNRQSNTDYFVSTVTSDPTKKVKSIGLTYGNNGSCYIKDWVIERIL